VAVTLGIVLRSISFNLGAIDADFAQLHYPHLMGNGEDLYKDLLQLGQEPFAELGNRIVIRMGVGCNLPKGHRIVGLTFHLATGEHPGGVPIKEKNRQHPGMIRLRAASRV
jgi:hypothetical protein